MKTRQATHQNSGSALISRRLDFWLLGGASCVVWSLLLLGGWLRGLPLVDSAFVNLATFANIIALLIFYPHFMMTYRMVYGRGASFIRQYWFQLVAIPATLVVLFIAAFFLFSRESGVAWLPSGISIGELLVSGALTFMLLTIGWHQGKQTFGCMMVYGRLDNYPLDAEQRRQILWAVYGLWFVNIINLHTGANHEGHFFGIRIYRLALPQIVNYSATFAYWLWIARAAYGVVYTNWRRHRKWPSLNFVIPLVALTLWWTPPFYSFEFYFLFSTTFHALQYWPFAIRYEEGARSKRFLTKHFLFFSGLTAAAGGLTFWILPLAADRYAKPLVMGDVAFFIAFVHVSLNIHHYFVDSTLWRFTHPEIQSFILGPRPQANREMIRQRTAGL